MIVNFRFDIFSNSNNFDKESIVDFIKNNSKIIFTKNNFLFNDEHHNGIDNIYIGNINTMYKLINKFFYELDDILIKHNDTIYQERLVYRINNILFDSTDPKHARDVYQFLNDSTGPKHARDVSHFLNDRWRLYVPIIPSIQPSISNNNKPRNKISNMLWHL
jgi:hypothetical protein